jgi:enoyl-CoA hydratase/carnithine racemase
MYGTIAFETKGSVALITLNLPDKRNPIGTRACGELVHVLARIKDDPTLRSVVLTGAGKVFSAGGDLSQFAGAPGVVDTIPPASMVDLFPAMHALGKPIIAMVNGHALAGGLGLMVACDLVMCSEAAELGLTEINLGLWPMMITAEIVRSIGRKKTLEMMLTGERISAREAERIGLVNRVVAPDKLVTETMALAEQLAAKSPSAMRLGLQAFYDTQDLDLRPALEKLQGQLGAVLATEDAAEGLQAFFQKRAPVWKGK